MRHLFVMLGSRRRAATEAEGSAGSKLHTAIKRSLNGTYHGSAYFERYLWLTLDRVEPLFEALTAANDLGVAYRQKFVRLVEQLRVGRSGLCLQVGAASGQHEIRNFLALSTRMIIVKTISEVKEDNSNARAGS